MKKYIALIAILICGIAYGARVKVKSSSLLPDGFLAQDTTGSVDALTSTAQDWNLVQADFTHHTGTAYTISSPQGQYIRIGNVVIWSMEHVAVGPVAGAVTYTFKLPVPVIFPAGTAGGSGACSTNGGTGGGGGVVGVNTTNWGNDTMYYNVNFGAGGNQNLACSGMYFIQ
jgi:hypothetical protein